MRPEPAMARTRQAALRARHARTTARLFLPVLLGFAPFDFHFGHVPVALASLAGAAMLGAALFLLREGARHLRLAEFLLTATAFLVIGMLLLEGGAARMGILWLPLLAFANYFLNGVQEGDRWTVLACVGLSFLIALELMELLHPAYRTGELAYALIVFVVFSLLFRFHEGILEHHVTRLNSTRDKLRKALSRALLPEENPDPVVRIAADGRLLDANPAARRMLQAEGRELPDRAPACALRHAREALESGEILRSEEQCGDHWLEWRWVPNRKRGDVSAYGRDITLRVRQESALARFGAALNATEHGILICNEQGKVLEANDPAARLFGACSGRTLAELLPDIDMNELREAIAGQSRWNTRIEHIENDETRHFDLSAHRFEHRDLSGFVLLIRDTTEQRLREEQLHQAQRLESLGVLAGGIAHDFNNLLTAILGNAALAEKKLDEASPARRHLGSIVKASQCAASLCNKMLAYSGKGQFEMTRVNLSELARDMVDMFKASINKSVALQLKLEDAIPPVRVDLAQMQQIMMNLIVNASEAIGEKSGVITIATGAMRLGHKDIAELGLFDHLRPGRYVVLEVSDTGCGMSRQIQDKLFEPFFTTKFSGRGLGMSAVLGIVRGHKGAIKVYSEEGRGTCIRILLPACEPEGNDTPATGGDQDETRGNGMILVVDDEEFVRESAAMILEDCGFDVITAPDGKAALELYRERKDEIDLVLLDMMMPHMNGEQTFRELKRLDPEVRVLLSSGYNEQEAVRKFTGRGLAGFIQKPYMPERLCEKCSAILAE